MILFPTLLLLLLVVFGFILTNIDEDDDDCDDDDLLGWGAATRTLHKAATPSLPAASAKKMTHRGLRLPLLPTTTTTAIACRKKLCQVYRSLRDWLHINIHSHSLSHSHNY